MSLSITDSIPLSQGTFLFLVLFLGMENNDSFYSFWIDSSLSLAYQMSQIFYFSPRILQLILWNVKSPASQKIYKTSGCVNHLPLVIPDRSESFTYWRSTPGGLTWTFLIGRGMWGSRSLVVITGLALKPVLEEQWGYGVGDRGEEIPVRRSFVSFFFK
jgi:hypothetical protein